MDQEKELINDNIKDLKEQIQQLGHQNSKIQNLVNIQVLTSCFISNL